MGVTGSPIIDETLAAVPTATGRLDRDDIARSERSRDLGGQRLSVQSIAPLGAGLSPSLALRRMRPAFADDRKPAVLQHAYLTHDSVAAAVLPGSAGSEAQSVALHAERILKLERLDWRRQGVRHGDVHPARPVRIRTRALPPADRLVIREALVAEGDIVHRALPLRGNVDRLP